MGPMAPFQLPIELQGVSLDELQELTRTHQLPPVDQWDPPYCGHSNMRIARDGTWFHNARPLERTALVRLFATILRREPDGTHVLVTPVEKLAIDVDCTAFRAVQMTSEGMGKERRLAFTLDSGDAVLLGRDNALSVANTPAGPSPRIAVRFGLEAELTRPIYYELAQLAIAEGSTGIWSNGAYFSLEAPE
jgi:hypothetical protein